MSLMESKAYTEDIEAVCCLDLPWDNLTGKSMLISGATGMIGSCLVDVIMRKNMTDSLNCKIYALGRNEEKARSRFKCRCDTSNFVFIPHDINKPFEHDLIRADFVLHLASNTHPLLYSTDPVGTIATNIIGTDNLLKLAVGYGAERFLFASSVEIYGENRGDIETFDESYLGYIDCNTLRAGYSESKRCGEALCQAYRKQFGLDVVIPRFSRVYGPTMLMNDTKASSQFILKAVARESIVLKSVGNQFYSYLHVIDAVSGLLTVLLKGLDGEAYNIADERSDIKLKDLAAIIAGINGSKVVFEIPDAVESAGFSKATKARLDGNKLKKLGWRAKYDIKSGMENTIKLLIGYNDIDAR